MKYLTKTEELVMLTLWELKNGTTREILEKLPLPKPAYNTVATIVKILVNKKLIGYNSTNLYFEYFPLITKKYYCKRLFKDMMDNYFKGSCVSFTKFSLRETDPNLNELEELQTLINNEIKKKKNEFF